MCRYGDTFKNIAVPDGGMIRTVFKQGAGFTLAGGFTNIVGHHLKAAEIAATGILSQPPVAGVFPASIAGRASKGEQCA
jgi:hypothetical protein